MRYLVLLLSLSFCTSVLAEKIEEDIRGIFNSDLPIDNLCSTEGRKKFTSKYFLTKSLEKTIGVSISAITDLFCDKTKVYQMTEVIPYTVNEKYVDKYLFNMKNKNGCAFQMIILKNKAGKLDISGNERKVCSIKSKAVSKQVNPFATGDRVYVSYQNGKKCKATVLIPGKEQSKIEYNGYCKVNFISGKSGEEWAPNHSLTSR